MMTEGIVLLKSRDQRGISRLIAAAALTLFATDASIVLAQGSKNLRTVSHSRERMQELIKEYSDSIDFDDNEATRARRADRRGSTSAGNVDSKALHPVLRQVSTKLTNLAYALNDQTDNLTGLKKVYTETLRLSGTATGILKRLDKYGVDGQMIDDLQQLDADWHELAYRLEVIHGLSDDARSLVKEINDLDKQARQTIGITQQLDRRQLSIKAASLTADLDNLQSDIALELGQTEKAHDYRKSVGRLRQIASDLVSLLRDARAENSEIVEEYEHFETHWKPLVQKLQSEDDRYIKRSVYRIATTKSEIHQLLLLPQSSDPSQYAYQAKALKEDLDQFFDRTPLVLVMSLPHSKEALAAADKFHKACDRFVEAANHGHDHGQIVESFRAIEQTQRAFSEVYRDVDSDRALAVLNRINQDINSIRSSLHLQKDEIDERTIEELAVSIQNSTEHIAIVSRRWLEHDDQPRANEWLREANDLAAAAERLHDDIVLGKRSTELKDEMTDLYERCKRVYSHLAKCQTEERQTFVRISSSLTPAITELRSIILH